MDPDGDGTSIATPVRFPGQWSDWSTGLHYNFFRDYDPQTGRYLEADPIGQEGGLNLYEYARSSPTNFADSTGLSPFLYYLKTGRMARRERAKADLEAERRQASGVFGDPSILVQGDEFSATSDFRHCLASCEIARKSGTYAAAFAGTLNEIVRGKGIGSLDNAIDQEANREGRRVSAKCKTRDDCVQGCLDFALRPAPWRPFSPRSFPVEIPVGAGVR
jgi:RHS repeat-associated protein